MSGDFGGYKALMTQASTERKEWSDQPLIDCPVCGEVLDVRPNGLKNCPLGHYRTRAATKAQA